MATRPGGQGFHLADAALANPSHLSELDQRTLDERAADRQRLGVSAHRLAPGDGSIFAFRRYSAGKRLVSDDEQFEKLTIFIPRASLRLPLRLSLDQDHGVVVVVTSGGSAWARDACSGYVRAGELAITRIGEGYDVRVSGRVAPAGNRDLWDDCKAARSVDYSFRAESLRFSQLTPWLGLPGGDPHGETHPGGP